ncbi:tautomerase family protein [Noviherbaspirillum massiliense]|uniref:tautomerase family protein n=1 Tax=Noviherbaspirillum massiliense TaxID=1465823 RepID=UPI0003115CC0|nr:tautomerase family protein [Noviherbaspirillum massiliense]
MPYVRITLLRGKPPSFLKVLSDSVHRALVEDFEVPVADRFQIIHQCEPSELVFDRHYLCGPRSDDFVLINVTAGRPRTDEVKQAFYRRLVEFLGAAPGMRPQDVMVVIQTTEAVDWSFGEGIAAIQKIPLERDAR